MEALSVCLNTQTPLFQFAPGPDGAIPPWTERTALSELEEGVDYRFSPGGVTRMVYALARRLVADGVWKDVHWVSLNPHAPETVRLPGITLHNVSIEPDRMDGYGKVKETIWTTAHGIRGPRLSRDLFWTDDYGEYTFYNRTTAERIRALDARHDFDLFYVHDFQQLPIGHMLGTIKPKIFRWHLPFDPGAFPDPWRPRMETYLDAYDVVVVSTDRYREALERFGHRGRVERIYPYVDPEEYRVPPPEEVEAFAAARGLGPDDRVVLVVGRMDPAKRQDRVVRATARLARQHPHLKLVLVGNGSFSSSPSGVGLSKGPAWRHELEELARTLGVADRVVFTGHVSRAELDALYERSAFSVLPSSVEGFGLVVVESWLHRRPTLVADRAGVAEVVRDGENGRLFDPDDEVGLLRAMGELLRAPEERREALGEAGYRTARLCSLDAAARSETRLVHRVAEA